MSKIYGVAPSDLGLVDISPTEMLFWLYCPIKNRKSNEIILPKNLKQFWEIVQACMDDCDPSVWYDRYVYITAKTLWVNPENTGQRAGWHCDGYLTSDINYIWTDSNPTIFSVTDDLVEFSNDHNTALKEMEEVGNLNMNITYPLKHVLRMDQRVLHRVADFKTSGMRSFVKISVSEHPFNLKGNSINHDLVMNWDYSERSDSRNPEVHLTDHKV